MREEKPLSEIEETIILSIGDRNLKLISYNEPEKSLGDEVKGYERQEVKDALFRLEHTRQLLNLNPQYRFDSWRWWKIWRRHADEGAYEVREKEVGELYAKLDAHRKLKQMRIETLEA